MKNRVVVIMLAVTLVVLLIAGCGSQTVKTGLGTIVSIAKSTDAAADKPGFAQVDTVMAAVTLDSSGKILGVKIDNAQIKVNFDNTGKITSDKNAAQKTKVELGKDYGLGKQSKIGKEWNEQIAELEKWMTGKTVDQVKTIKTKKGADDAHPAVPDVAELNGKVSITIQDYIAAVTKAAANAK